MTKAAAMRLTGKLTEKRHETADIVMLRITPDAPFDWQPGQYVKLGFEGQALRDYSIACPPGLGTLEFHIRDTGTGPSHYVSGQVAEGETVAIEGPYGVAAFEPAMTGPILAIGGGSGLAPMKAITEAALAADPARPLALYHGVRAEADLYLVEYFRDLARHHPAFRFVPVLSDEPAPSLWAKGLVGERAARDPLAQPGTLCFLAGPPDMVDHAEAALKAVGIAENALFSDPFHADAVQQEKIAKGEIRLS